MSALLLPSRRVVQPQGPVEVDWSNPLSRGLVFLHSGASFGINLVDGKRPIVQTGTISTDTSLNGKSVVLTSATLEWDVASGFVDSTMLSLSDGYAAADNPRLGYFPVSANEGNFLSYESGALKAFSIGGGSFPNASFTTAEVASGRAVIAAVYSSTNSRKLYLDGVEKASNTGVAANASAFSRAAFSYRSAGSTVAQTFTKKHAIAGIWGRALTQAELVELYVNPWRLLRPLQRRIWVSVGSVLNLIDLNSVSFNLSSQSFQNILQNSIENSVVSLQTNNIFQEQEYSIDSKSFGISSTDALNKQSMSFETTTANFTEQDINYINEGAPEIDSVSFNIDTTSVSIPIVLSISDQINNIIYIKLRENGYTGSLNEMLRRFFGGEGTLQDCERFWLSSITGVSQGTNQDLWTIYLNSLGYEGTFPDMLKTFWINY